MVAIVGEVEAIEGGGKRLKSSLSIGYRVLGQVPIKVFMGTSAGIFFGIGCILVKRIDSYYDNSPTPETLDLRSRSVGFVESAYPIARQQRPSGGGARLE